MRPPIHVLIVDDSALIRQILSRALALDPRVEVVGVAKDGVEAIEKARSLNPDVITLDVEMPGLNGIEVLAELPRHSDARAIMLSSRDDPETAFRALAAGAVDFIPKPEAGVATSIDALAGELSRAIRIANRASMSAAQPHPVQPAVRAVESGAEVLRSSEIRSLVAIASSTGGPPALERVLSGLGSAKDVAYAIVQHLPDGFAASLAKRLTAIGSVPVILAEEDMVVESGNAYLAPWGAHMYVERAGEQVRLRFDRDTPSIHGVRPSADPLFESVAATFGEDSVGVVLTGMGHDAAEGMVAIARAGGATIAQDEASSVVWGMPGAAVRRSAARRVVPLSLVAAEVRRSLKGRT